MRRRREISPLLSPFLADALTCGTYFVTSRWWPVWPAFLPRLSDAGFDPSRSMSRSKLRKHGEHPCQSRAPGRILTKTLGSNKVRV